MVVHGREIHQWKIYQDGIGFWVLPRKGRECVRMYSAWFQNSRVPSHAIFANVGRGLQATGQSTPETVDCGRVPEEEILEHVGEDQELDTREIGRETRLFKEFAAGASWDIHDKVRRIVKSGIPQGAYGRFLHMTIILL